MLLPVRMDDPNRWQKEYYRRKRAERCAYQRAYEARRRGAAQGVGVFAGGLLRPLLTARPPK